MSVYVSQRNVSKLQFLETARKLSAHTLTYCLKAPKRLTFFLTKEYVKWKDYAFQEWGRLLLEEPKLLKAVMESDLERYKNI